MGKFIEFNRSNVVNRAARRAAKRARVLVAALVAIVGLALPSFASTPVTLPDPGFDLGDYITAVFEKFAEYFSSTIGYAMLFIAIGAGIMLIRRMVKGAKA